MPVGNQQPVQAHITLFTTTDNQSLCLTKRLLDENSGFESLGDLKWARRCPQHHRLQLSGMRVGHFHRQVDTECGQVWMRLSSTGRRVGREKTNQWSTGTKFDSIVVIQRLGLNYATPIKQSAVEAPKVN